jgi:hypothetical protein
MTLHLAFILVVGSACIGGDRPAPSRTAGRETPTEARWCRASRCSTPKRFENQWTPYERPGSSHCGWQSATFIAFRNGQYVRDEKGRVVEQSNVTYDPSAMLPQDARFTGWRRGDAELWVSPLEFDEIDAFQVFRNIYIVHPDSVERLPHFGIGCL